MTDNKVEVPVAYLHQLIAFYEKYKDLVQDLPGEEMPPAPTSPAAEDQSPYSVEELLRMATYKDVPVPEGAVPKGAAARKMSKDPPEAVSSEGA